MAGTLTFPIDDDFRAIVEHAANTDPGLYYGMTIPRSLYLVKDRGVYLMSAGSPGLLKDPNDPNSRHMVVYANGHNPNLTDTWAADRAVCGGDDFAEPIDVRTFEAMIDEGAQSCIIKLSRETIRVLSEKTSA